MWKTIYIIFGSNSNILYLIVRKELHLTHEITPLGLWKMYVKDGWDVSTDFFFLCVTRRLLHWLDVEVLVLDFPLSHLKCTFLLKWIIALHEISLFNTRISGIIMVYISVQKHCKIFLRKLQSGIIIITVSSCYLLMNNRD